MSDELILALAIGAISLLLMTIMFLSGGEPPFN